MIQILKNCAYYHYLKHADQYIDYFTFKGIKTWAKCVTCHDIAHLDMAFYYKDKLYKFRCRLAGIGGVHPHCPAIYDWNGGPERGKKYLERILLDKIVYIECDELDATGHIQITVFKKKTSRKSINSHLLKEKWAKPVCRK